MKDLYNTLVQVGAVLPNGNLRSKFREFLINNYPELLECLLDQTAFLDDNASMSERVCCIKHNYTSAPLCAYCNTNKTKYRPRLHNYARFCSTKCSSSDPTTKNKTKQTNLNRYGVEHATQLQTTIDKRNITNIKKYGYKSARQAPDIKEKIRQTILNKYGTTCTLLYDDFKQKAIQTKIAKYGTTNILNVPEIVAKRNKTILDKYGTKHPLQNEAIKHKVKTTNIIRYGTTCSISSRQRELLSTRINTNRDRYNRDWYQQSHICPDALALLNNRDWLIHQHHDLCLTLSEIAVNLKVHPETIRQRLNAFDIEIKRHQQSTGEKQLGMFLTECGISFETNVHNIIPPKELDIFIPSHNIAIEYCGVYWHSDKHERINRYTHADKYNMCEKVGVRLITLFEDEWLTKREIVEGKIKSLLMIDPRPVKYARCCKCVDVDTSTKRKFFDKYHIQGDGTSSITIGLVDEKELVACMGFTRSKDDVFYLTRYATSQRVVGGFSKLLAHFQRTNNWKTIITFADLRWSNGNLYERNGFELDTLLPPDYTYSIDGVTRQHKFNFRRRRLATMLPNFDPNLSERKNCDNHNILRIWDCGKKRYVLYNKI